MFKIGRVYNRRTQIHDVLGGNRQSGIANCSAAPHVLLFSNKSGSSYGYEDGWRAEDEVFIYTTTTMARPTTGTTTVNMTRTPGKA